MREFFAMGGYAAYVWSSFALTALVLWFNGWSAARRHRQISDTIRLRLNSGESNQGATIKEVQV
ncbi:MAG: heme exporter protein CcmD [Pseudomonadota bacterium]